MKQYIKLFLQVLLLGISSLSTYSQQLDATFSVVPGSGGNSRLQMVLNSDAHFLFNQSYTSPSNQNSVSLLIKNVYNSAPSGGVAAATGLSYSTSIGITGTANLIGGYGFDYGLYKFTTDEVVNFTFPVGATIVSGASLTIPAGTVAQTGSGSFGSIQTFNTGPYTAFIPEGSAFATIAASMFNPAPEINLKGNSQNITSGSTATSVSNHTDFGSVGVSAGSVTRTFTIENAGTGNLSLSGGPSVSISGHSSDFTVSTQPVSATVAAAASTTFQITFDPTVAGVETPWLAYPIMIPTKTRILLP